MAPVVREQTLKSVLTIITKLSDRTINGELLRYLAKTANDEQPGIRTNTTICLGKIAKHLGTSTRSKVLIAAFARSLRDPFVHARNAALLALAVTSEYFTEEDCAGRLLPVVCPLLIDKEKLIRDQANKTVDALLQKVRSAAAEMPDTALPPETAVTAAPRMSTPQTSDAAAAATAWAGWAISSFTNKLSAAAGEIQASSSPAPNGNGPSSAPSPSLAAKRPAGLSPNPTSNSASALHRQALKSPLSRTSSSGNIAGDSFFRDPEPVADDDGDAWGDMNEGAGEEDDAWGSNNNDHGFGEPARSTSSGSKAVASSTPFDDSEPDFAGWLAAQAQKKTGPGGKPGLPKGLAKATTSGAPGSRAGGGAAATKKVLPLTKKPVQTAGAKKALDMKPKQTEEDEDGWGGW